MARAISTGTISFGLVSIPVKLYSATQSSAGVSFNLLHGKCGSRLKQQYVCPVDNEVVARDDMVKGYEFAKDQYVTFTPDELKALEEKATQSIEIAQFVPRESIDPLYYEKAYYLGPEKGGEKAYRLLATVMRESNRAAVARYAARGKQYIVMLRVSDDAQGGIGIIMQTLLYADEVRPFSEVPIPDAEVKESEVKLAKQLVDQIGDGVHDPCGLERVASHVFRGRHTRQHEDRLQARFEPGEHVGVHPVADHRGAERRLRRQICQKVIRQVHVDDDVMELCQTAIREHPRGAARAARPARVKPLSRRVPKSSV